MIELAVAGASGRVGRCTLELATVDERFTITAALTDVDCPTRGSTIRLGGQELTIVDRLGTSCEVLIDFTTASGTMAWLDVCKRFEIPMVIGATGHDENQLADIREASRIIPIVKAVNFSVGVQAVTEIAARLAKELGEDYDIEVVETHHRHKIDAPSGTALAITEEILRATGRTRSDHVVFGRHGETGERPRGQVGVHAIRLGDAVGQHEVHFSGNGETITLRHTVHSRETFAAGALRAAAWVVGKEPGLYSLRDTRTWLVSREPLSLASLECIVELEDPRGAKMRIQLKGNQSPDVGTAVGRVLFRAGTWSRSHPRCPSWWPSSLRIAALRRSCETEWSQHFPQRAVSAWLGHSETVSQRHYLQVTDDMFELAAALETGAARSDAECVAAGSRTELQGLANRQSARHASARETPTFVG